MSTTIEQLDQQISGAPNTWPIVSYDSYQQVDLGTLVLFDALNPVCWPGGLAGTGAVGTGIAAGASFVNLANEAAELAIDGAVLPTYDSVNQGLVCATTAGLVGPVGAYDLAALGWPNFHLTVWHKLPTTPAASSYKLLAGYATSAGGGAGHEYGVAGAYTASATVMGSMPNIGVASNPGAYKPNLGTQVCSAATMVDTGAGDGSRRVRTYINNVLQTDTILTPSINAAPTAAFRLGKGTLATLGANESVLQRAIFDNCGITGVDPEVKRQNEWLALHSRFGM